VILGWGPRKWISAFALYAVTTLGGAGEGLASQAVSGRAWGPAVPAQANPAVQPGPLPRESRPDSPSRAVPLNSLKRKFEESKVGSPDANAPLAPSAPPPEAGTQPGGGSPSEAVVPAPQEPPGYAYRPESRRDPFMAIVLGDSKASEINLSVPPLQRVAMSELSLIGIIWGGFGYVAMVQTPDGRGYTVREGTKVGSANGVVSSISPETLTIREPFSDVYGRKEMREHVMSLHPKSNVE
jgi:Tfp pilus assembly protein PilP